MASEYKGVRNKSYTLPGIAGGELTISETTDRQSIAITVREPGTAGRGTSGFAHLTVHLTGEQFVALCRMDSCYDGLAVEQPARLELVEVTH